MNLILSSVLGSTVLLSLAAVAALVLRGTSAANRHALWLIAMVCSLLVPVASMVLPGLELPLLQSSAIRPLPVVPPPDAADVHRKQGTVTAQQNSASSAAVTNFVSPTPSSTGMIRQSWSWRQYAAAFWALGFIFSIGELSRGIWRLRSLLRSSQAVTDPAWLDLLPGLRSRLSVSARVFLAIGREPLSPMTSGLVQNVILFPPGAVNWPVERRRLVLAHELAHVRRRDGILQIVIEVICAVYWFNPLAWYAARQLRLERERACDDEVLSLGADADDYASHLLDIAREIVPSRKAAALAISMTERSQLECRLQAIVDPRGNRRRSSRPLTVVLLCSSAVLTVLIATVRLTALPLPSVLQVAMVLPAAVPELTAQPGPPASAPVGAVVHEQSPSAFVKIPPGEFTMGCGQRESCSPDGAPPHVVQITRAFEIGKYELTQAEWQSVMATNPSDFKGADLPVEQVSWSDVQEFLRRLNAKRDGYQYRLPTEAEWEYAARAGAAIRWFSGPAIPPQNQLPTPLDPIAWYGRNSDGHTHPVGQKQPNAWGLYDMFGNVEELVQDWYSDDYFAGSPSRDPSGPSTGTGRVVRGGPSWDLPFSPEFRHDIGPESRYDFVGFRIVRVPIAQRVVFGSVQRRSLPRPAKGAK